MLEDFKKAIDDKLIVKVTFQSKEEGAKTRMCIPFDFGPWRRNMTPNPDRYHFYDLDSPEGSHNLSVLPDDVISIETTDNHFDPAEYIKWAPNWFVQRDWGEYS